MARRRPQPRDYRGRYTKKPGPPLWFLLTFMACFALLLVLASCS